LLNNHIDLRASVTKAVQIFFQNKFNYCILVYVNLSCSHCASFNYLQIDCATYNVCENFLCIMQFYMKSRYNYCYYQYIMISFNFLFFLRSTYLLAFISCTGGFLCDIYYVHTMYLN
jgi:hypothetical protein